MAEIARPAGRYNPSPSESTDEKEILLPTTFFGHVQMEISRNQATPSSHPFLDGIFHYKPSIWGYPHLQKPPNMPKNFESFGFRQHAEGPVSSQVNTTCLQNMPKTAAATPSWYFFIQRLGMVSSPGMVILVLPVHHIIFSKNIVH